MAISDINANTPSGQDQVLNGDNEIRDLKGDIVETLGGLDKAVMEDADTNGSGGSTPLTAATMSSWEARINALENLSTAPEGTSLPVGSIVAWYGSLGSIPVGFGLCDGTTYQYTDGNGQQQSITTPDLRGRFVMGMGWDTTQQGDTGGLRYSNNVQVRDTDGEGNHVHTVSTPGASLTQAQMPSHGHGMFGQAATGSGSNPPTVGLFGTAAVKLTGTDGFDYAIAQVNGAAGAGSTENNGSGQSHTHPTTNTGATGTHQHSFNATQPFCALYYICYVAG